MTSSSNYKTFYFFLSFTCHSLHQMTGLKPAIWRISPNFGCYDVIQALDRVNCQVKSKVGWNHVHDFFLICSVFAHCRWLNISCHSSHLYVLPSQIIDLYFSIIPNIALTMFIKPVLSIFKCNPAQQIHFIYCHGSQLHVLPSKLVIQRLVVLILNKHQIILIQLCLSFSLY